MDQDLDFEVGQAHRKNLIVWIAAAAEERIQSDFYEASQFGAKYPIM